RIQEPDHARDARDPHDPRRDRRSGGTVRRQGGGPGTAVARDPGDRERDLSRARRPHRRGADHRGQDRESARAETNGETGASRAHAASAARGQGAARGRIGIRPARGCRGLATVRDTRSKDAASMIRLPPFTYLAPTTIDGAAKLMAEHGRDAMVVAGGARPYPHL